MREGEAGEEGALRGARAMGTSRLTAFRRTEVNVKMLKKDLNDRGFLGGTTTPLPLPSPPMILEGEAFVA